MPFFTDFYRVIQEVMFHEVIIHEVNVSELGRADDAYRPK